MFGFSGGTAEVVKNPSGCSQYHSENLVLLCEDLAKRRRKRRRRRRGVQQAAPVPGRKPPLDDLLQIAMAIPEASCLLLRADEEEAGECCQHLEASDANGMRTRPGAIGDWRSSFVAQLS